MTRGAPSWLGEFQARFGSVLREPLDRTTGTLIAKPDHYDPQILAETLDGRTAARAERLAVYNRQYWFRMFEVLQGAFPLTCRLAGHWAFNEYAAMHLLANPPRGWDIESAVDGFASFFASALGDSIGSAVEREAYVEAARIDAAFRDVFRAPLVAPFRPSPADAARLLDARLVESPAAAILEEHSALFDLRRTILHVADERRLPLPDRWAGARFVALVRSEEGTAEIPLEHGEAELLRLLREHPVREALGRLEAACPPTDRARLPEKTRLWLARSVERGWWTGMR